MLYGVEVYGAEEYGADMIVEIDLIAEGQFDYGIEIGVEIDNNIDIFFIHY